MNPQSFLVNGNLALSFESADTPSFTIIDGAVSSYRGPQPRAINPVLGIALIVLLVTSLIAVGWTVTVGRSVARAEAVATVETTSVAVSAGDSLWSIAAEHGVDGLSTQDVVEVIRELNEFEQGTLQPGMELVVPVS